MQQASHRRCWSERCSRCCSTYTGQAPEGEMGSPKRKLSTHTFFAAEEEDDVVMIVSPLSPSPHKKRSRKSGDTTATEVSAWSNVADDSGINADSQLNDHSSEEIIAETEATINSSDYLVETPNNHPNDALTETPPDPSHPIPAPIDPSLAHISADSPTPIDPHIDLNIVPRIDAHRNVPSDPGNNPNNDPSNVTPSDRSNDTPSDPGSVCLSNPTPDHLRNLSLSYPSEASFESCPPWQRATSSIRDRFKMIFDKCEFSDCSVCCVYGEKQKTFSCHKVVLSMTSAKLSSLLLMKTNICIDLKPEVFEVLLQYMYLDSFVMPSVEAACDIYKAALHYDIPHLLKLTRECMLNKITPDNFWRSFELALDCDDKQLATGCCDFLAVHPSLWDTFSNVKKPLVRFIVDMETLNVSEKTILKAIDAWAVEQCRQAGIVPNHFSKREFIDPEIMAKIRFLVITPQDFVAYCTGKDSFLTKEEMLSILCCLTVPHSSKLPSWVCSQTTSRGISEMFRVKRKKRFFKPLQWEVGRPEDSSKDALALGGPTKSYPVGSKRFTTYFTTNKTIILRGVQVPGLWYPPFNQEGNTSYEEDYTIEVRDPENKLLSGAIVTLDVPFASQVDIIFKDRISLNAHVEYSINISTCQTYFLTNHLRATVVTKDVQFHFKDSVMAERKSYRAVSNSVFEDATQCSFVIQIMFSLYI